MSTGAPEIGHPMFFRWVRQTLIALQGAILPPDLPTNVRATALAGAIQVDFTRSDGDSYILYWNSTPSIQFATRIELGGANKYVDDIGSGSVKRYYALSAKKGGHLVSGLSPWVSATSLALGTAATPPQPPPATQYPFTNQQTDSLEVGYPDNPDLPKTI